MPYKCHIPQNLYSMLDDIPAQERPEDETTFWKSVAGELSMLIEYASHAREPEIVFWDKTKSGDQYLWAFYVNDLALPAKNTLNWHGQNVSQWLYAGAIVLQTREVPRHH